jgi:hypothetical protein
MNERYRVLTYHCESGTYTPQVGLPEFVDGFGGLRGAIRALRECGYAADTWGTGNSIRGRTSDSAVWIERVDGNLNRTCPRCGKVEPVTQDVIDFAKDRGWPDVVLCLKCVLEEKKHDD